MTYLPITDSDAFDKTPEAFFSKANLLAQVAISHAKTEKEKKE